MRWRVGNYYYSFLREIHVISVLRQRGIDVRFHPLADALFRVDAWSGHTALSLYVGNKEFKRGDEEGRKWRTEEILDGAGPLFSFETIELKPADKFDIVYLAKLDEIHGFADQLQRRSAASGTVIRDDS